MTANKYKKKLIEVAIPLDAINRASVREKNITHGHPNTLHLWWARRPLATCRAILFAQLVDDPSSHPDKFPTKETQDKERQRLFEIIEDLVEWKNSAKEEILERAKIEIRKSCGEILPTVYDPFSGGCSIPLEAQRLGLRAYGSDLNPVAAMIGKATIEIPPLFKDKPPVHPGIKEQNHYRNAEGLAEDISWYAQSLNDKAFEKIGKYYPKISIPSAPALSETISNEATVSGWLWARTVQSPNPALGNIHVPLISTFWLCEKKNKLVWIEPIIKKNDIKFEIHHGPPSDPDKVSNGTKSGRGSNFRCLISGEAITADYVKAEGKAGRMGWKLMAIVVKGKKGLEYLSPDLEHEEIALSAKPNWRPEYQLATSSYMSVTNYGPKFVSDLFTNRQLLALNTFTDLIEVVRKEVLEHSREVNYANAIATYLSLTVDRLASKQSTHTTWAKKKETIRDIFTIQAIPMKWDTMEGNPFSKSSGNFLGQIKYLVKTVVNFPASGSDNKQEQLDARAANFSNCVISTDPPYYDNIGYANLSDFFYVWLRRCLKRYYPEIFETVLTPKEKELVADQKRHGGKDNANRFFLEGMKNVICNMAKQGSPEFPASIYYAFKQSEVDEKGQAIKGWATFLQSVIDSGYNIVGTWPLRTERPSRARAISANALATSVVLVCRRRNIDAEVSTRTEFIRALKQELPPVLHELLKANITPVDLRQASIGPGIGIFSRYKKVIESDDSSMTVKTALQIINKELDAFLTELKGEFDPDTRFAVTWFKQNGMEEGNFGEAEDLARACGILVKDLSHAGIVKSSAGKVRLLSREEFDEHWTPNKDTVWECTQYLIRALESSEDVAANILKQIEPNKADAAKELAYYLHDICDNQRQTKEAIAYNRLIKVWTDLTALANTISDEEQINLI